MGYTIGDGIAALALIGGIVGYVFVKHRSRQHRLEIIHRERLAAMEKGIPLPELPPDPDQYDPLKGPRRNSMDSHNVIPLLGTVLLTLSGGAMIALNRSLPDDSHAMWIAPLPFGFLGVGLIVFHFLASNDKSGQR